MQTQANQTTPTTRVVQRASLPSLFAKLLEQKVTGKLVFVQPDGESSFFFISGRFLFAVKEVGRVRRWYRAAGRYCPELKSAKLQEPQPQIPWEYQLLCQELTQKRMTQQQARAILVEIAQEVLLPLLWVNEVNCSWRPISLKSSLLAWIPLEKEILQPMQALTMQVLQQGIEWATQLEQGLVWVGSDVTQLPEASQQLIRFLDGRSSLWDLAALGDHSLALVLRHVDKIRQHNGLEFRPLDDFPIPMVKGKSRSKPAPTPTTTVTVREVAKAAEKAPEAPTKTDTPTKGAPLIACIDDSKTMCQVLEKILVPAGYEVLKVYSPLQDMGTLVSRQPDLMLLDLMMPDIDGYSLCTFLRKTPIFKDTPIIILTSSSGVIDRARAISAGASGFLGKPPDPELLLATLKKYFSK
jgi:two-component system, chemotaxis family, response regulator PixG